MTTIAGTPNATYTYDYSGRRSSKTVSGSASAYLYDGLNLVTETAGATTTYHLFGPGIDEPLASSSGASVIYHAVDGLGSLALATDAAGTVQDSYTYDAWGVGRSSTETFSQPFRYTAREVGDASNDLFYRARFLAPLAGRFLSEDPLRLVGDSHFFRYSLNDPFSHIDPLGLRVLRCWRLLDLGTPRGTTRGRVLGGLVLAYASALFPPAGMPFPGNNLCAMHEFLYDTDDNSSIGSGPEGPERGESLDGAYCTEVPTPQGKCAMRNFTNREGTWRPLSNNCHSAVQRALDACHTCN